MKDKLGVFTDLETWSQHDLRPIIDALGSSATNGYCPAKDRVNKELLDRLSELYSSAPGRLGERAVESCYSEAAEHALHPDGYGWADAQHAVVPLQRQPNQVVTPEVA